MQSSLPRSPSKIEFDRQRSKEAEMRVLPGSARMPLGTCTDQRLSSLSMDMAISGLLLGKHLGAGEGRGVFMVDVNFGNISFGV